MRRLQAREGRLRGRVVFSPDNKLLAVACITQPDAVVCQWDVATGKQLERTIPSEGNKSPFSVIDGGLLTRFTKSKDREFPIRLYFWDVITGEELVSIATKNEYDQGQGLIGGRAVFCLGGRMLAVAGQAIYLYPVDPRKPSGDRLGTPRVIGPRQYAETLALSPDAKMLATVSGNRVERRMIIRLWETSTGKERARFTGHDGLPIHCLAFSPEGRRLASGCWNSTILIWDVTGRSDQSKADAASLSAKAMDLCWASLAAGNAEQAGRAIWALASAGSDAASFLAARLHPISPIASETVSRLIAQLDDRAFTVRQEARQKVTALGELAESHLRRALTATPSVEKRRTLNLLLEPIEVRKGFLPAGEELRSVRAIEVLEHIGSPKAREVLERLSGGVPGIRRTEEAKVALARLSR